MSSLNITRDRVRPSIASVKLSPHINQETELLTFSPIIGQPQRSPLIKNGSGYKKHTQLVRRGVTFLTLKYGFVILVIASSVATLCDINKLKVNLSTLDDNSNNGSLSPTQSNNETNWPLFSTSTTSPPEIGLNTNFTLPLVTSILPTVPLIIVPANVTLSPNYRSWVYHKMKIPLYVYMAVALGVLFIAIFGRTMENFLIPFGFGMFMLLEIGIMIGLCTKESEYGLCYSPYLWTIYILVIILSFSYASIIAIIHKMV